MKSEKSNLFGHTNQPAKTDTADLVRDHSNYQHKCEELFIKSFCILLPYNNGS